jgi:hypothetical protein
LLIGAGYVLGHEWTLISAFVKQFFPYLLAGGVVVLAVYFWYTRPPPIPAVVPVRVDDE